MEDLGAGDEELEDLKEVEEEKIEEEETDEKDDKRYKIPVDDLKKIQTRSFEDRESLKSAIKEWSIKLNMKLSLDSMERVNFDGTKVTKFLCSKRKSEKCNFFLEFRFDPAKNTYQLKKYKDIHNHASCDNDYSSSLTPKMLERIRVLAPTSKNCGLLRDVSIRSFQRVSILEQSIIK